MSRAFVKETAESAAPPERMVSEGPNLVTEAGAARIAAEVQRLEAALKSETNPLLRETLARDLRYWSVKQASAQIVPPPSGEDAAFGSRVTIRRGGREQTFRIVGEDEADPAHGLLNFKSPLAAAILGTRKGDVIEAAAPIGEIEILEIEN
ncbi:MAG TPA: GreA/GreB family elongation factor [Rhizomicrobium sp.]